MYEAQTLQPVEEILGEKGKNSSIVSQLLVVFLSLTINFAEMIKPEYARISYRS
jgi:hypothetical protein